MMSTTEKAPSQAQLKKFVDDTFLAHPRTVNETYMQHLMFSLKYGSIMIWTGIAFILHGLVPRCHQTTASTTICRIYDLFKDRMNTCDKNKTH